jgi:hypothetical protein
LFFIYTVSISKHTAGGRVKMLEFLVEAADVVLDVILNALTAKKRKHKAQSKNNESGENKGNSNEYA